MENSSALYDYWRRCLADVDLRSPNTNDAFFPLNLEEVTTGRLPEDLSQRIFEQAEQSRSRGKGKRHPEEDEKLASVALLVAPFGLRRRFHHGTPREADAQPYYPLWIPARLARDGATLSGAKNLPWIGREFLRPVKRDTPVIGKLEDLETCMTQHNVPAGASWSEALKYADSMLQAVTGHSIADLQLDDFEILTPVAVLWSEDKGIAKAILTLYDRILKLESLPPLLRTLADGALPRKALEPYALDPPGHSLLHLGQMSAAFPLSPSQRQAVQGTLALEEGELLAVNGPPGTGKTTFLQSVVASLWVEAALANGEPPVIVACSTNNQAVTNILDSFAAATSSAPEDAFVQRWLPGIQSYGLYLPSFAKFGRSEYQEAAPGFPTWLGLPELMETPRYLAEAETFFLGKARQAWPEMRIDGVAGVVAQLHQRLTAGQSQIAGLITDASSVDTLRRGHGAKGYDAALQRIASDETELHATLQDQEALHAELLAALESISFWEDLLSFLPPIRRRLDRRLALPFQKRHLAPPAHDGKNFAGVVADLGKSGITEWRARLAALQAWRETEERFAKKLAELGAAPLAEPGMILDLLDPLRYKMFVLAGRYWEGRWLLEMSRLLSSGQKLSAQNRAACVARWRRFSMITPCMVATFYQAPKVFVFWDREAQQEIPLFSFMDLLIVDEAGQVSPEVGAATFSLAKRALVVGDIHQIEPVWSILPAVDAANLQACGIDLPKDDESEDADSFRACRGSVMLLARRATALACEGERGLLLSEHRRCVPEIIRYCNELVYGGRLQALRPSQSGSTLPALGWAHITSPAGSDGGSRINPGEAQVIADWVARHRQELEDCYKRPITEIVAVITPFVAQKGILDNAFRTLKLTGVQAGTVHSFQGAERPVILFSPVYSLADAPKTLFFDSGPNLLNVAVSRAKDSFLVFGDLRVFDSTRTSLPSGKLASLLFESQDNEVIDVESAQHLKSTPGVRRIASLEDHRALLRRALEQGRESILIVSPFLKINAVKADGVASAVAAAKTQGARVCIVYSRDLSSPEEQSTRQAVEALEQAGAQVKASNRMHSKTLAVDQRWIAEGSFNWLSASRDPHHPFQRHEVSMVSEGPEAQNFITAAWKEVGEPRD